MDKTINILSHPLMCWICGYTVCASMGFMVSIPTSSVAGAGTLLGLGNIRVTGRVHGVRVGVAKIIPSPKPYLQERLTGLGRFFHRFSHGVSHWVFFFQLCHVIREYFSKFLNRCIHIENLHRMVYKSSYKNKIYMTLWENQHQSTSQLPVLSSPAI